MGSVKKEKKKVRKTFWIFLVGCVFLLLFLFLFVEFILFPRIELKGGNKVILNYLEEYKEKGYSASHFGKNITKNVSISGKVNSKKLGDYKIVYRVKDGAFQKKVVRTVLVRDRKKPSLSVSSGNLYICPGSKFEKEEVTAKDNYDGDLTSKIKTKVSKDKVTYTVRDSNGNEKIVSRKFVYEDHEKPVITLLGSDVVDMCVNEVYKDPGYEVLDNCDSNLSSKVVVDGSVDNSLVGEYDLSYKVVDKAGNEGSAARKVRVSNGDAAGVVYLTFDDGPNEGTTNVILDILKEEGVEATFFVTSKGPDELIKREFDEGHTVALHTSSHDYATLYASDDAFFQDLQTVSDRVLKITGVESKFIRFPGGSSNTVSRRYSSGIMSRLTKEVVNRGYKYYDWNISSGDAGSTTDPNEVYSNVVNSLRKDRVNMVLMHDIKPYTRDALRRIIQYCKENGYPMRKISNCTEMITQRVNN